MSLRLKTTIGVGVALLLGSLSLDVGHAQSPSSATAPRAFIDQYCVACHSDGQLQRGLVPMSLQGVDMGAVGSHAELWEKVARKVRGGMMPPPGARRPDAAARVAWVTWLESELDRSAGAH